MYLPRGWVHEAQTSGGGPSMHLTITVKTGDYCIGHFLRHMLKVRVRESQAERGHRLGFSHFLFLLFVF